LFLDKVFFILMWYCGTSLISASEMDQSDRNSEVTLLAGIISYMLLLQM